MLPIVPECKGFLQNCIKNMKNGLFPFLAFIQSFVEVENEPFTNKWVNFPSFITSICFILQLEETCCNSTTETFSAISFDLFCFKFYGTALVSEFDLWLSSWQHMMVCADNCVNIGKHCWGDNTHSVFASCIWSHQGGQWGQVHADGEHATGEAELAELSLPLG